MSMATAPDRTRVAQLFRGLQDVIATGLAGLGGDSFTEETWERPGGGGGRSRVLQGGTIFERAGVNFAEVHGELSEAAAQGMPGSGRAFYATGVSVVVHPRNPYVPTVHANFRFFEKGDAWWFGGGSDLTPWYLFEDDARHFHETWKAACDRHGLEHYSAFKASCDEYFLIGHRRERRGVGGIFFDYLRGDAEARFAMVEDLGRAFLPAYLPIVERRKGTPYGEHERNWQLLRRGRYVEFNLVYDRGTLFGLRTDGRVESILMSLPPLARWETVADPAPESAEGKLLEVLRVPRDWV
jgi:coproporphyrinogen III oxidase